MYQAWGQKRFDAEYNSRKKFIENDVQELIAFRLNVKGFKTCCKERNIIFEVNRIEKELTKYLGKIAFILHENN